MERDGFRRLAAPERLEARCVLNATLSIGPGGHAVVLNTVDSVADQVGISQLQADSGAFHAGDVVILCDQPITVLASTKSSFYTQVSPNEVVLADGVGTRGNYTIKVGPGDELGLGSFPIPAAELPLVVQPLGALTIGGNLAVSIGVGAAMLASNLTVNGTTRIFAGGGATVDQPNVEIDNSHFGLQFQMTTNGNNNVLIDTTKFGGNFGYTSYVGSSGVDNLAIESDQIIGNTNINLGGGNDSLDVTDSFFFKSFTANGGPGNDTVTGSGNSYQHSPRFLGF
jgi:hypothetical protein